MIDLPTPPAWIDDAVCASTDPEVFFPTPHGNPAPAKAICAGCPVRQECADYALARPSLDGVWGGLTARERGQIRSRKRRAVA